MLILLLAVRQTSVAGFRVEAIRGKLAPKLTFSPKVLQRATKWTDSRLGNSNWEIYYTHDYTAPPSRAQRQTRGARAPRPARRPERRRRVLGEAGAELLCPARIASGRTRSGVGRGCWVGERERL